MKDQIDIKKVLRQQLEIDAFFTGDFALKGQQSEGSGLSRDPAEAAEGTIRKSFATSISENAVHGSDSDDNADVEAGFFFGNCERVNNM